MFPFFEPNLFPLLEGGRLIFYIFLRKGNALLLPLLRSAGLSPAGGLCITLRIHFCILRMEVINFFDAFLPILAPAFEAAIN